MKNNIGSHVTLRGWQAEEARVSLLSNGGMGGAASRMKQKIERDGYLSLAPKVGVIVSDLSLNPIAMDEGAHGILADLRGRNNIESDSTLPNQITDPLRGSMFSESSTFQIQLRSDRYDYNCRVYALESPDGMTSNRMLLLHLERGSSANDAVSQLAAEFSLTDREEQVIVGISLGLTSKELADRMHISPNTVRAFLRLIMVKMGVTTRSAIVGRLLNYNARSNAARAS
jgi:DNA-binding CsgD family transcriptional regulator